MAQETLSFKKIQEYLDNHPKIYQYIVNKSSEEIALSNGKFTLIDVINNSIVLFLAIRKKLGWEIWPEDIKGPYYSKSNTILYDSELLAEVHSFTINELQQLLRYSNGFLGYVAYERLPYICCEEGCGKDIVCILKALFKYRYQTNEDFELVFGPKEEDKEEPVVPMHISGNILEGMSHEEIKEWAQGQGK